jgi:alkylated DNA repair dioxygenase AlkB
MQFDFFAKESQELINKDGLSIYYPNFFETVDFDQLKYSIQWRQDDITLYGKTHPVPRLQAWYGDDGKSYSYSSIKMEPLPWNEELMQVKKEIEIFSGDAFNSCLCNLYRDGKDYVAWHSDDEKELGRNPVIASASFGEARKILFKHKTDKGIEKVEKVIEDNSLIIMSGALQHHWVHQISKTSKKVGERINLTFRQII